MDSDEVQKRKFLIISRCLSASNSANQPKTETLSEWIMFQDDGCRDGRRVGRRDGVTLGVATGVAMGVATGVTLGVATGVAMGVTTGVATGVVT